jgi:hypothetical protein
MINKDDNYGKIAAYKNGNGSVSGVKDIPSVAVNLRERLVLFMYRNDHTAHSLAKEIEGTEHELAYDTVLKFLDKSRTPHYRTLNKIAGLINSREVIR